MLNRRATAVALAMIGLAIARCVHRPADYLGASGFGPDIDQLGCSPSSTYSRHRGAYRAPCVLMRRVDRPWCRSTGLIYTLEGSGSGAGSVGRRRRARLALWAGVSPGQSPRASTG